MKKLLPYVIGFLVAMAAVGVFVLVKKDNQLVTSTPDPTAPPQNTSLYPSKDACSVLTQEVATAVLGAGAAKNDTSLGATATTDIAVTTCSYTVSFSTVTLLIRAAKTGVGANSNADQFKTGVPSTAQIIEGYGDKAYWDPALGQLNILAHHNWYILSNGGLRPADKTLDGAKQVADRIKASL